MRVPISEPTDQRLSDYVRLTDIALRLRSEAEHGLFLGEGELVITRALDAGHEPRSFLLADNRWELMDGALLARMQASGAPIYTGPHDVLEQVTGYHVHRGSLASFHRRPLPSVASVLAATDRVLVLEEVNNHTNVGAMVRGAAALGFGGLLLDPRSADPLYRRAVRVSMGSVFRMPFARVASWPEGLDEVRAAGFRVLAMALDPTSVPLDRVRVAPGERIALMVGAEGPGLTAGALERADARVVIPMAEGVDSLNVAAAAAVACYALRA